MRAKLILAAAALAALPAAALAQRDPEAAYRMRQAQENLRIYEQQQRQQDQQQRIDNLDARVRTQENLQALPLTPAPVYKTTDAQAVAAVPDVINFGAQNSVAAAELAAQNQRLRQLDR